MAKGWPLPPTAAHPPRCFTVWIWNFFIEIKLYNICGLIPALLLHAYDDAKM
jgi:hypothetical protein